MDPSDLENLSPEQIQQLVALGVIPDEQSDLQQQYQIANELRTTPTPQMYGNGRIMVAASPLEHIAVGLQRYKGMKDMKDIQEQQKLLREAQVRGRTDFLKQYMGPPRPMSLPQQQGINPTPIIPLKPMSF
jgi:hypothetical protein